MHATLVLCISYLLSSFFSAILKCDENDIVHFNKTFKRDKSPTNTIEWAIVAKESWLTVILDWQQSGTLSFTVVLSQYVAFAFLRYIQGSMYRLPNLTSCLGTPRDKVLTSADDDFQTYLIVKCLVMREEPYKDR